MQIDDTMLFDDYDELATLFYKMAAKQLLITKDYSIARIAADCGFYSQSYFNYSFKKQAGLSPLKYRKKMLSQIDI